MKGFFQRFFAYDGKFVELLTKSGELIMLSFVYLVCCIPVITIGSATASLYYAVMKNIRRDRGTPLGEFFSSMRRTLLKGSVITVIILLLSWGIYEGYSHVTTLESEAGRVMATLYFIIAVLLIISGIYIFPILSRFEMKIMQLWQLAFVMGIRFFPFSVLMAAGTCLVVWLQIYILPIPCILFIPGVWCFLISFVMERALLHYMPKPKEGEDAWYYVSEKSKKSDASSSGQKRGKE